MSKEIRVFVNIMYSGDSIFNCKILESVGQLKSRIFDRFGIPIQRQQLLYSGNYLADSMRLCDYYIFDGTTIHLVQPDKSVDWSLSIKKYEFSKLVNENYKLENKSLLETLSTLKTTEDEKLMKKRVTKEIDHLLKFPIPELVDFSFFDSKTPSLNKFKFTIHCKNRGLYENGHFSFALNLVKGYPFKAPKLIFLTEMFHPMYRDPNEVSEYSSDLISFDSWKPGLLIRDIILSLSESMSLENIQKQYFQTSPKFPDSEALKLLKNGKFGEFCEIGRLNTLRNATPRRFEKKEYTDQRKEYCMTYDGNFSVGVNNQMINLSRVFLLN